MKRISNINKIPLYGRLSLGVVTVAQLNYLRRYSFYSMSSELFIGLSAMGWCVHVFDRPYACLSVYSKVKLLKSRNFNRTYLGQFSTQNPNVWCGLRSAPKLFYDM